MNLTDFIHSTYADEPHIVLFGNPVGHSLSPLMHNSAARHYNLGIQYHAVELKNREMDLVADFLQNKQLKGVNLTIPFKYDFISYCDSLDATSSTIKAVNALVRDENGWKGYNSDVYGFSIPLKKYEQQIQNKKALIFGSGGAAKAVAYALKSMGLKKVIVVSRNPNRAGKGVRTFVDSVISYEKWPDYANQTKLIVNTTPLGMDPYVHKSPVKDVQIKHLNKKICYDLIYNPAETKFLKQAEKAEAVTINGLDMLIHQGSKLFELWTGKKFPQSLIKNQLQKEFDSRN